MRNSQWRAFLMTPKPVPEPTSILQSLLALAGGVGLAMKYKISKQSHSKPKN